MSGVFRHLSLAQIGNLISQAKFRAIVASPGIDETVAAALIRVTKSIGIDKVQVILDVDEENCRAGYGNVDGYSMLIEAEIPIRRCPGLRIGFVLADDVGFIFGLPPLMVEAPMKLDGCPNAVRATPEQIDALEAATRPPLSTEERAPEQNLSQTELPLKDSPAGPEIGLTYVGKAEVAQIEQELRRNPVQDFDLSRVVRVFAAHVQFVELKVEGTNLEAHTVKLPSELLTVVRDPQTRARLTAAFKMISEGSMVGGADIREEANEIRRRYIHVNPRFGGVVLKAKMDALRGAVEHLSSAVEAHRHTVAHKFREEADRSKGQLFEAFWRAIESAPPDALTKQLSTEKPSPTEARHYLWRLLDAAFPNVDRICERMGVSFVTKDVTWETLNDRRFVDWLADKFPVNEDLRVPFEAYRAARGRLDEAPGVAGGIGGQRR